MYAGGVCWTLVYDSIYAHQASTYWAFRTLTKEDLQDKTDDVEAGIRSTALLFGDNSRAILSGLSISTLSLVSLAGYLNSQTLPFYCGIGVAAVQLARVLYRTEFNSRISCWKGFVGCGWSGFWIWMGALGDYTWLTLINT